MLNYPRKCQPDTFANISVVLGNMKETLLKDGITKIYNGVNVLDR